MGGRIRAPAESNGQSPTGHERIDRRSLALHRAVAEKLRAQPSLLGIVRDNLERWAPTAGRSAPWLDEWTRILQLPLEDTLRLIGQEGGKDDRPAAVFSICGCAGAERALGYLRAFRTFPGGPDEAA